ncbi:MAG: hypothetical protein AB1797_12035 [bacterium]
MLDARHWTLDTLPASSIQHSSIEYRDILADNVKQERLMLISDIQFIFIIISCLAVIAIVFLAIRDYWQRKEFGALKAQDAKTILGLIKDKEILFSDILTKLDSLSHKEEKQQGLLVNMLSRYEEEEKKRQETQMNMLDYKVQKWQDQMEDRITQRFIRLQKDIEQLDNRLQKLEKK